MITDFFREPGKELAKFIAEVARYQKQEGDSAR